MEVVKLLLARGATIHLRDHQERNCLDLAVENNHKDVAEAIIRHPDWRLALGFALHFAFSSVDVAMRSGPGPGTANG